MKPAFPVFQLDLFQMRSESEITMNEYYWQGNLLRTTENTRRVPEWLRCSQFNRQESEQ